MRKTNSEHTTGFTVTLSGVHTRVRIADSPETGFEEQRGGVKPFFLFDTNTRELFNSVKRFHYGIPEVGNLSSEKEIESYVLEAGEKSKSLENAAEIARKLLEVGAGRDSLLVAVGGGVVCDIAAFVASIYMRGMRLVLMPTTLLAMVDASLGGKTGVDFEGYKNILGTFYPAEEVVISPSMLDTLPEREYRNGLAELIKHALLDEDDFLFDMLEQESETLSKRDKETLGKLVIRSLEVKARYVEADPKEKGIRGHLNLGHTFAHALESHGGFSETSHGEAVAWGIAKALDAGVELGVTEPAYAEKVKSLLLLYGYSIEGLDFDSRSLVRAMRHDKKKKGNKLRFILQKKRGETFFSEVPEDTLYKVLSGG